MNNFNFVNNLYLNEFFIFKHDNNQAGKFKDEDLVERQQSPTKKIQVKQILKL